MFLRFSGVFFLRCDVSDAKVIIDLSYGQVYDVIHLFCLLLFSFFSPSPCDQLKYMSSLLFFVRLGYGSQSWLVAKRSFAGAAPQMGGDTL